MQQIASGKRKPLARKISADALRRKAHRLAETGCESEHRQQTQLVATAASALDAEAAWSRRYTGAAQRYQGLDLCSQRAVSAVIEGLIEWALLVPQRSIGADGKPEPANKWGLGVERSVLRGLHSHLITTAQPLPAARIHSEMADLLQTAESLDECCMCLPHNPHAEKRLVATARIHTAALVNLLSAIKIQGDHSTAARRRKRGAPRRQDPLDDRRLMAEWAQVRGKAGMTRKEFCAVKRITMRQFIRAQDRVRKQAEESTGDSRVLG